MRMRWPIEGEGQPGPSPCPLPTAHRDAQRSMSVDSRRRPASFSLGRNGVTGHSTEDRSVRLRRCSNSWEIGGTEPSDFFFGRRGRGNDLGRQLGAAAQLQTALSVREATSAPVPDSDGSGRLDVERGWGRRRARGARTGRRRSRTRTPSVHKAPPPRSICHSASPGGDMSPDTSRATQPSTFARVLITSCSANADHPTGNSNFWSRMPMQGLGRGLARSTPMLMRQPKKLLPRPVRARRAATQRRKRQMPIATGGPAEHPRLSPDRLSAPPEQQQQQQQAAASPSLGDGDGDAAEEQEVQRRGSRRGPGP
ncbi:hypothetical protein MPTK1_5g12870 [Marchantia polymorpha subsp. ruderalis]|uniref:Uncharacterized protein n=2 Tax=Marchantia polymorpha TaxID=3197 RepID=A0AAF6BHR7_MARPO|nr:hypothetical protein MARPO_0092s0021 [Marchantia polymorpha]BBN11551.1 hypothetical protein Mp_5g12870 [Marchantia polymorpha subsp. ruderalis]|eukprot:PTQ33050.1 hypothetical protein MARPO_0092s0021 [Marchantia polymorpha]